MSDLIDRKALRAAHGLGSDCHDCKRDMKSCQYDRDYSLMDFCEWLDDAPTASPWHRVEEPPKWVSVFDDLPRKNAVVVVSDGKRSWDVGQYHFLFKADDRTIWWWKKHTTRKVLWWMYKEDAIPEPPKEDAMERVRTDREVRRKEGRMNKPTPSEPRKITITEICVYAVDKNGEKHKIDITGFPTIHGTLDCETGTLILEPKEDA